MKLDFDARRFMKKNGYLLIVILITSMAFWVRSFPAQYGDLQALDPYYFYRMGEHVLNNDWQLPERDMLRYYPMGISPLSVDYLAPIYMPALSYAMLTSIGVQMTFLQWAIIWPAIMGALAVFMMFFLGKELFNSKFAGYMAAFLLAFIPAFVTRTSAGFFEKEPIAGFFMVTSVYFFVRAYKKNSWISGALAGVSIAAMSTAWGGTAYIFLLYASFVLVMFVAQGLMLAVNYLFPGSTKSMIENLEGLFNGSVMKAFIPTIILGIAINQMFPKNFPLSTIYIQLSLVAVALLLIRYGVQRFGVGRIGTLKNEHVKYVVPSLLVLSFIVVLFGSMFFDPFNEIIRSLLSISPESRGLIGTTVAENAQGTWGEVTGRLSTSFSAATLPFFSGISEFFAVWLFMVMGSFLMVYEFLKTRNWMYVFVLIWVFSGIWAVFGMVRLVFLVGPPAALAAAYFLHWIVKKASNLNVMKSANTIKAKLSVYYISVPLVILLCFTVLFNFTAGVVFAQQIGPSINSYWKEGLNYMAEETPEDSVILSWWDFGYWFQTIGKRASVADGGNMVGMVDETIADWFISPVGNWSQWEPWLKEHGVTHILMDYTLPGKYGAISKIGSRGDNIQGFMQFTQTNSYQKEDNVTVFEFRYGPYVLWLPSGPNGQMAGLPMFLVAQGDQFTERYTITKLCTDDGIQTLGTADDSIGGCAYLGDLGVYYIQEDLLNTVFVDLMFMEGSRLPVEKVFDNTLIKIYEVDL